jgi:membrane fusion protein, multidrug efflux system
MTKLSRSLFTVAVLLIAGGAAAYVTRDKWRALAPAWLQTYIPPSASDSTSGSARGNAPDANAAAGGGGRRGGRRGGSDSGPIPVLTADAATADVPVTLDGVGTVRAFNTVTITPQVGGQIVELPFKEGQDVKKGDVIARIDDSTYKASLDQTVAKRAQDQALLDNAKIDLQRYEGLVATNSVTKQTADTQRATVAQDEAQLKSDDAAIASAKATLAYTVITAPIDGRTGIRNVDAGNVVQANSGTGIVTLSQMKPISVLFNLPQQSLADIIAASAGGTLQVQALRGDNKTVIDTGTLDVIDNQVDSTTGTIKLKANFPNDSEALWPGAFVNARLLVKTLKDAVVVPTAAVQRGPNGTFLYVLVDGKAQLRTVTLGQQGDQQTVVDSGLKLGEKVITTGFARLSDGSAVEVTTPGGKSGPVAGAGIGADVGDGNPPATPAAAAPAPASTPQTPPASDNPQGNGAGKRWQKGDGNGSGHRRHQDGANAAEGGQSGSDNSAGASGNAASQRQP